MDNKTSPPLGGLTSKHIRCFTPSKKKGGEGEKPPDDGVVRKLTNDIGPFTD
jgi:hypothetical protein